MTHTNCPRCGGRLARDNDSGRCTPCQAAERDRMGAPPAVPASFWNHEPVRQALASRHLGRVIRAYRFHPYHGRTALSQTVVAGWLGITQAQLSRVENGPPVVHLDRLAHWAKILGIPNALLWFSLPDVGLDPSRQAASWPGLPEPDRHNHGNLVGPPATPASSEASTKEVVTTDRRQFHTLAALAGLGSMGEWGFLATPADESPAIGLEHVRLATSLVKEFRQADAVAGANQLCDIAIHVHGRLSSWAAKARYSRDVAEALQASLADLAAQTAWLAIDAGRRAAARPYLNDAITRARLADDSQVEVRALAQLALLNGDSQPTESLHCADAALRISAGWATPRLRTLLHLRRACAFAALQDRSAFEREMRKARQELERGPHESDPEFIHFVNFQEVQGLEALSFLALDQPRRAAEALRDAITTASPAHRRNQVYYRVRLAEATHREGDVNEAALMALDLLPEVKQMNSRRVTRHLADIRSTLGQVTRPTTPVRNFIEAFDGEAV
ncbi:helix-turn-helix domain-containing protein [Micromonospora antibiotica]|uniref:helix-turn-helix domain-containing protein n=1 Tax=Micromonospora antibiotica TaxID=2807623 RepID=UPI0027DB0F01|nr:helix-turn-helix transcriptional regulator [Micromonospora antibiotica]